VLYVALTAVDVVRAGKGDPGRADAIVVLGAAQYDGRPSPLLESRLVAALELWRGGVAPLLAVTGGKQEGDRFTESDASRAWLEEQGVPATSIVSEDVGTDTWESLSALMPVLREQGVDSAIAVTSPWHVARSVSMLDELGFDARGVEAPITFEYSDAGVDRWAREIAGVGLGRIVGFERLAGLVD
jgi:uncharacterized SAM-binding protein YcdF (DUF218 family)